jgi:hypothetical protein
MGGDQNFTVPVDPVISYSQCQNTPYPGGFAVNPAPVDGTCLQNGCHEGCLRTTTFCSNNTENWNPKTNSTSFQECVAISYESDIQPMAVFLYLPFFVIFGIILVILPMQIADNSRKIVPLSIFLLGIVILRQAIYINNGCPYDEQTWSSCGTGEGYEVKNLEVVQLTLCSNMGNSPFATGETNRQECLLRGCGIRQCLKEVQACGPDGGPVGMGDPVYSCVNGVATGSSRIDHLFISIFIILLGLISYFLFRNKTSSS